MNWSADEEKVIAAIMRAESTTRIEAIRTMRRRTINGVYRAPATTAPAIGKLFA